MRDSKPAGDSLFTQAELRARLPQLWDESYPMQIDEFELPNEEHVHVHRADLASVPGAVEFWVSSFRAFAPQAPRAFAREAVCRPISRNDLEAALRQRFGAVVDSPITAPDRFLAALTMYDDWDTVALLVECRDRRMAFYWETHA